MTKFTTNMCLGFLDLTTFKKLVFGFFYRFLMLKLFQYLVNINKFDYKYIT